MDIALHRSREDIEEDLEYYFSEQRDKHNQIRPRDDIRSLTPDAARFAADPGAGTVGNLFHPFPRHSLDRIFIGISFPLFAHNWGAAFLRHLLELIKPEGAIILPVYPEMQAREKGLWCRSSLENIFRSRSRFIGTSNIWAENDGVMSMRVGRSWPPVIPSTARWLFQQAPRRLLAQTLEHNSQTAASAWLAETSRHWRAAQRHAVVEQIIRDVRGPRTATRLAAIGDDAGLIALECLLSPYTRVTQAWACGSREDAAGLQAMALACATRRHGVLEWRADAGGPCDVLCLEAAETADLEAALAGLPPGGHLILAPECLALQDAVGPAFEAPVHYSSRVAQQLQPQVPIYHYSSRIQTELAEENATRQGVFAVLRKA